MYFDKQNGLSYVSPTLVPWIGSPHIGSHVWVPDIRSEVKFLDSGLGPAYRSQVPAKGPGSHLLASAPRLRVPGGESWVSGPTNKYWILISRSRVPHFWYAFVKLIGTDVFKKGIETWVLCFAVSHDLTEITNP